MRKRRQRADRPAALAPAPERLQKVLADAGFGSRREIENWIRAGRLQINGRPAELGQRVDVTEDRVQLDRRNLSLKRSATRTRVVVYNKPEGEICSRQDPEGRRTVFAALPPLPGARWITVGRLDMSTTGLLLFTNNGALANALMHPGSTIEREYLVRIRGKIDNACVERLLAGVQLDDGPAAFDRIERLHRDSTSHQWLVVGLSEGRNREVRRLFESQRVQISRLKRTRYGPVSLSVRLGRGMWQEMDSASVNELLQLTGQRPTEAPLDRARFKKRRSGQRSKPAGRAGLSRS